MPTLTDLTEDLAARWRTDAGDGNPAGPLFVAGPHAEADIVQPGVLWTGCSVCTPSRTVHCC
jgi:hypothetical protein